MNTKRGRRITAFRRRLSDQVLGGQPDEGVMLGLTRREALDLYRDLADMSMKIAELRAGRRKLADRVAELEAEVDRWRDSACRLAYVYGKGENVCLITDCGCDGRVHP